MFVNHFAKRSATDLLTRRTLGFEKIKRKHQDKKRPSKYLTPASQQEPQLSNCVSKVRSGADRLFERSDKIY